jgi:hypothetical protein
MKPRNEEDQAETQEQLRDVYFAGTSDGKLDLGDRTITVPNNGYNADANEFNNQA